MATSNFEMNQFDYPSIVGACLTWFFIRLGMITPNEYAVFVGIIVGVTTIGVNIMKFINEYRKGKNIDEENTENED